MGLRCDYAFCTGDLRHAPSGKFAEDSVVQIREICNAVHTPLSNLFLVPGNHDINRDEPGREDAVYRVHKAANWHTPRYYQPQTGKIEAEDLAHIATGKREFHKLLEQLYTGVPGRFDRYADEAHPHFLLTTDDLNIIHLDSTLTYTSEQWRDLVVGTELLLDILEHLDQKKPTVLLTHYSFDFLTRDEQREMKELLREYRVQLWLAGHEHDHLCRRQWDTFYEFQCGNLVLEKGATSCVLTGMMDLDTGEGSVRVHAWFPGKGWAEYPFVRTGTSCDAVYPFYIRCGDIPTPVPPEEANAAAGCGLPEKTGGQFSQITIHPELIPDLQWEQDVFQNTGDTVPVIAAMDALWENKRLTGRSCHALLLGNGGMGKSTMMFHACKKLIRERHTLAVFASLQTLQSAGLGIERHLLRTLYQVEDENSRNQLLSLMNTEGNSPSIVLLVDGFNELNGDTSYQYAAELKRLSQNPGLQIFVSSRLDFLRNYGMAHFQMLRTCDLRDSQIRTLFGEDRWPDILGKRHLHILLKNPMMALLYAQTYPLIEKYRELPYCDWQLPVSNAADLLHNYYLAQVVFLVERENTDKKSVYFGFCAVRYLYLRHMHGELWGQNGLMTQLLAPYRGREIAPDDFFVENLINCWLAEAAEDEVVRDLSRLDLRRVSLADHLKRKFGGSIVLSGSRVSKETFVNERRHDSIVGIAFSHDGRTLAAVSKNGIVSVSNILTQSQMIIGEVRLADSVVEIGYTAEDYLMLVTGENSYIWPTIAYDKMEPAQPKDSILRMPVEAESDSAAQLQKILKDSKMLGQRHVISDDRRQIAVGHSSGHIQVWDAHEQTCIAELSFGDSQVVTASFSPGGEFAALCAGGPLVQLWNVKQRRCLDILHFEQPIRRVRFPSSVNFLGCPFLECEYSNGRYIRVNIFTGHSEEYRDPKKLLQLRKELRRKLKGKTIAKVDQADNGNAIVMEGNSNRLWTWNQATRALNICQGHTSAVLDAAICRADPRYAASYSNEAFHAKSRQDRRLEGQKLVRAWAIRKGNCMQRLPTDHRTIRRLQFFTTNRILLAAFATNGDIILWELTNTIVRGEEHGHWDRVDTVRNSPAEPLECAVSTDDDLFIGVYTDGTLFSRTFSGKQTSSFQVFPGIDLSCVVWDNLICSDSVKKILERYKKTVN